MKIIDWTTTSTTKTHYDVAACILEDGKTYNLAGWNGEEWRDWWEDLNPDNCGKNPRPVYRFEVENIDLDALEEEGEEWYAAIEMVEIDLR